MSDPAQETTKKFARLMSAVGALGEDLHGQGIIDLEQVRLTIKARQKESQRLVANGKSIRQTAKELGVDKETVRADLGLRKVAENPPKVAGNPPPMELMELLDSAPERWLLSIKGFAYDAARLREYWDKEFPEWETYKVFDEEIYNLVKKAISEWSEIGAILDRDSNDA